jgi:hypothetical protein
MPSIESVETPAGEPSFEERWTAWQARGEAHDREVRRNLIALLPAIGIAAVTVYVVMLMW